MRRLIPIYVLVVAALIAGCGSTDSKTPVACLEGKGVYLSALREAPGEVKLAGETPISECFAENQQAGELATIGEATIGAATELNAEARAKPGGDANLQLGYLLGAAQRGTERTDGIHAELLRRLTAAARYSPENQPLPATYLEAYREGFDAGEARG